MAVVTILLSVCADRVVLNQIPTVKVMVVEFVLSHTTVMISEPVDLNIPAFKVTSVILNMLA